MAVIKSGATTDQWTIDPTSKAGRVTLYDTTGAVISPASTSPTGSAVPANALFIGGTDGTNLRGIATDASGQVKVLVQNTPSVTVTGSVAVTQSTTPWTIQGDSASGAANAGNPVKIGGAFNTTQPTVTNGQTVDAQMTARGAQIVSTGVDTFNVTVNAALPAGSNVIGHVITDSGSTTVVTGTVTVSGTVTANQGTAGTNANGWPVKLTDGTNVLGTVANPLETTTQSESTTGAAVPAETTYIGGNKSGNLVGVLIDASGNLQVAVENTVTVSGTVAVTQSTSPWVTNMTQWASTALGTPTNFGTTPGAVIAGSVNASVFAGTTAVSSANPLPSTLSGLTQAFTLTTATPGAGNTQSINMLNWVNTGIVVTSVGVGGNLVAEVSIDNGVTWTAVDIWDEANEKYIQTITVVGQYWIEQIGAIWFTRVRATTLTSGTITGTLTATMAPNMNPEYTGAAGTPNPNNVAFVGGTDGTNIRALSTDTTGNVHVINSGTSNTAAATWAAGTTSGTTVTLVNGSFAYSTLLITLNQGAGISAGALSFEASNDNTNWVNIAGPYTSSTTPTAPSGTSVAGNTVSTWTLVASTYTTFIFNVGDWQFIRVRVSTTTAGGSVTVGFAAQSASSAIVYNRDLKDTGRTFVTILMDQAAGIAAEAVSAALVINKGGTQTTAQTTYTVTAGKTLRLQSFTIALKLNAATAANTRVRVRAAAAATAASPIVLAGEVSTPSGTALALEGNQISIPIPDGIEIAGGQQVVISHVESTATGTVSAFLVGYEY